MKHIGADILCLGFNSAVAISSHEHLPGYLGNHIYFSDSCLLSDVAEVNENSDSDIRYRCV